MRRCPWEVSPQLTEQRLRLIASTFDRVRDEVFEAHEPDKGDGNWGFGCRAYERTCFQLSKLSEDAAHRDWLKVEAQRLQCTLRIGDIPIKFYRGEPTDPTPRALRGGVAAALRDAARGQATMHEKFGMQPKEDSEWFWLIAIETHGNGTVSRVILIQATEAGDVRNDWEVPLESGVPAVAEVATMQREGVDLAPPMVGPKVVERSAADSKVAGDGGADRN